MQRRPDSHQPMTESPKTPYVFAAVLTLAVLGIYLPGLDNGLIFDDLRLRDGAIFGEYGSLLHFKQRMLSYGSFVWVQDVLGEGWGKQRLVNIAVHLGVVAALYALLKALLVPTRFPEDIEEQAHFAASRLAATIAGASLLPGGRRDALRRLRESLDPEERTLLVLRLDQELEWDEVATVLSAEGAPVEAATLRKRYERIKDRMSRLAREQGLLE